MDQFHSWDLPRRKENMCLRKDLLRNVHSSTIPNGQKAEITQMSINRSINKMWNSHMIEEEVNHIKG